MLFVFLVQIDTMKCFYCLQKTSLVDWESLSPADFTRTLRTRCSTHTAHSVHYTLHTLHCAHCLCCTVHTSHDTKFAHSTPGPAAWHTLHPSDNDWHFPGDD